MDNESNINNSGHNPIGGRLYFKILITLGNLTNDDGEASVLTLNFYSSLFFCSFLCFVGLNHFNQYFLRIIEKIFNTNQRF